jgi:hypothetical protein
MRQWRRKQNVIIVHHKDIKTKTPFGCFPIRREMFNVKKYSSSALAKLSKAKPKEISKLHIVCLFVNDELIFLFNIATKEKKN